MKKRMAVFASGSGSNYQSIMESLQQQEQPAEVAVLICDKPEAKVLERAAYFKTPVYVFNPKVYKTKADYEKDILRELQKSGVEWIILAGYMRLIGETLLTPYDGRIINIHPSLLPDFPGKDAIGQALQAGVRVTGVTVHYVDSGMDTGKIIAQEPVKIEPDDTSDSLQQRIQRVEHRLYPETINKLLVSGKGENVNS